MVLTEEEADKIKEHLLKQLGNFPEEKREQIKEQVESMSTEQVENFVDENNLDHLQDCVFCAIAEGKTPSFKIAEDSNNIAVLDINPVSKGDTLVIPKKHQNKIMPNTLEFAQLVAQRISQQLKPQEVKSREFEAMGHQIIEIVPIYGDETERKKATPEELKEIADEILNDVKEEPKKEVVKEPEKKEEVKEEIVKVKPRIP